MDHRLLLVRHTETAKPRHFVGWADVDLSAAGEAAVKPLASAVAVRRPTVVYSSDLLRCRVLAAEIAQRSGLREIHLRPELREENFGRWEEKTWEDLLAGPEATEARAFLAGFTWRTPPDGESFNEMAARVFAECDRISALAAANGLVVVVTHSGPIRALHSRARGVSLTHAFDPSEDVPFGAVLEL